MKIATVISVHKDINVVYDTLDSVLENMTEDVLVLIDGSSRELQNVDWPVFSLKGFKHGVPKSPFRNMALGLQNLVELFPYHDWYCYLEYDCLIASERFKYNLNMASEKNVWMLGCDGHIDYREIPIIEDIIGEKLNNSYYLLGACQFFNGHFLRLLKDLDFFDKFLHITNTYTENIPGYFGYDVNENMYPSLARHFGGNIGVFSSWDSNNNKWHGSYDIFPIRWKPDIQDIYENASIYHPIKFYDNPIREYYRKKRYVSKFKKYSISF